MTTFIGETNLDINISAGTDQGRRDTERQYGAVYDLLSEGEIQGLVGGLSGVYFNGVSLIDRQTYSEVANKIGVATITGTAVTNAGGLFADISLTRGARYMQVKDGGKSSTLSSAVSKGENEITVAAANFFEEKFTKNYLGTGNSNLIDNVKYMIRIAGAGPNGDEYKGIVTAIFGTNDVSASIYPAISTGVSSGAVVAIDDIVEITSITDDNTATLASAIETNVVAQQVRLSPATVLFTEGTGDLKYDDSFAILKTGKEGQLADIDGYKVPAVSYILSRNDQLTWLGSSVGGSASPTIIPASAFNFSQNTKDEIDELKVQIEFPAGLFHNNAEGDKKLAHVEFQIILRYKTSSSAAFISKLVYGINYGGADFLDEIQSGLYNNITLGNIRWNAGFNDKYEQIKDFYERRDSAFFRAKFNQDLQQGTESNFLDKTLNGGLISRKGQNTSFIAEYTINLEELQPLFDWEIEIRRLSPDKVGDYAYDNNSFVSQTRVKAVQASIRDKFRYPKSAYAVVGFSAQDFGQPPSRAYHLRGRKIKVPDNYITREERDSVEARYTRDSSTGNDTGSYQNWTGSFRDAVYTNNPAWVFYDILTNRDYGLGEYLQESDIDKYALYQIARYCDELVPDGKGGTEPRFACNVYLQRQEEAYKVLKDLASTFRAMMFWIDGKITPVQDNPKEPVYTFTQGNVQDGLFSYTYTGQRTRTNQVSVTWNNPDEFYKQTILTVDDTANILDKKVINRKDVVAFGCTSESQARRLGEWHLKTDTQETELVTFTTSINASFMRPGDIINVQDRRAYNIEASGRVSTGSTANSINLDRTVTFPGGGVGTTCNLYLVFSEPGFYLQEESATINSVNYSRGALLQEDSGGNPLVTQEDAANMVDDSGNAIRVQFSKNTRVEVEEISNTGTSASTITTVGSFTSAPGQDTIWAISQKDDVNTNTLKEFRIASISETKVNEFEISATQYTREKFDEIEIDTPVYTDEYNPAQDPDAEVPAVTDLTFELIGESISTEEGAPASTSARVSWTPAQESFTDSAGTTTTIPYRFLRGYSVKYDFYGEARVQQTTFVPQGQEFLELPNVSAGTYTVTIRTVSDLGIQSKPLTVTRTIATTPPQRNRSGLISRGGTITAPTLINSATGLFSIEASSYSYVSPAGIEYISAGGSSVYTQQSFAALSDGDSAFLLFDYSSSLSAGDPWKAIQTHTDNTVEDINGNVITFNYLKELGAANNGLTSISGTVSTTQGSSRVTGSGTSFTTEFSVGDLIVIKSTSAAGTEVSDTEYREVAAIKSDTSLEVVFPYLRTRTGVNVFKQSFTPDIGKDALLAEISRSGSVWSADIFLTSAGRDGASVDIVFQRSATQPSTPSPSEGLPADSPAWYTNPPSGTELLWASKGTKNVGDVEFTWGTPYQVEGSAVVEVAIYKKDDSNTPSGGSYNFTTNSLNTTGLTSGWSQTPPATLGNLESVYKSVGLFVGGPEETAATTTWSLPAVTAFRQDGSIGNDARTVKLTPSSFVINYSTAGAESDTITFTTAVQSISGSPTYRFLVDGVQKQNSTTSTFTLADADEPAIGDVVEVSVEVYDNTPSLLATDSVSIYAVQDGSDAIIGLLTNAAHTVSADNSGTVSSFSGAGGTFKVFVGGTEVTTSCTFSVVGTPASTTTTINSSTGVYDITALSANQDNVTYQAVIPAATAGTSADVTITAIYSISKSIKGDQGFSADVDIIFQRNSSAPATPSASAGVPNGWDTNPPAGTNILWASNGTKEGGATNYTWSAPYQIEGTSVAEVYIYRLNSSSGATGGSYNFTTNTLTAPTNWSTSPPALSSDTDKVYVAVGLFSGAPTATAVTTTWSTPVVYAERQDGTNGIALNLTATPVSFSYDGSAYDPDGTSTISLSVSGGTVTSVAYSDNVAAGIGAVATGNNSGSTFTFQNNLTLATAKASATVTAAVTGTDSKGNTGVSFGSVSAKIPTTIQGADGADGVSITGPRTTTGHIYYQSSSTNAPSFPSETSVTYNWSTGRLSGGVIGTGTTNWNQNPPTFASGNTNKYWYVPYSVTEASFGGTITVDFVGSTVYQGIGFSGLVTFSAGTLTDGSTSFDPDDKIDGGGAAADVNNNTTTINGGKITADSITANQIQISREDGTGSGIWLDYNSGNSRIRIFQGTTERVTIGFLS